MIDWVKRQKIAIVIVLFFIGAMIWQTLYFSQVATSNALREQVESLTAQVDFVFVSRAVAFYHKKHPKATAEELKQVEFLAKVLVQIAAEGTYKEQKQKVNPDIVFGILLGESRARPTALGPKLPAAYGGKSAIGAYQINPVNVVEVKKDCPYIEHPFDLWDVYNNTCAALSIYNRYLQRHGTEWGAVLAYSGYHLVGEDSPKRQRYMKTVFEFSKS